ncbi:hypothetical protein RB614_05180 [Phytohabitans sp. ZYX-F-186]|uniref:Uncharacterized protein n=1 Tax=Phytohabitans maris TaxID=3071409 RepID=A0ABU0ZA49_9ACTN|nr:hypothetical protein [Phytohabitans sp. ZYX-F-186]MDQ7903913.1 hypothetical protein [Phytohabitans sp. ZYX-F-186]
MTRPLSGVLQTAVVGVLEPVLRVVQVTVTAVLEPIEPILGGLLPGQPGPAEPDGQGIPPEEAPGAEPPAAAPQGAGTPAPSKAAAGTPKPAGVPRWTTAGAGPWIGGGRVTAAPEKTTAAPDAAGAGTVPTPSGAGFAGCALGGCAHTSDAINAGGQPLVLPAALAVRPDVRGRLVTPPTDPTFTGRLPGVAPAPG